MRLRNFGLCALWMVAVLAGVRAGLAAEIQVRTDDGQILQGEHLETKNGLVKLQTRFGVVSVPERNIVTILAAKPEAPAGAAPAALPDLPRVFSQPPAINIIALVAKQLAVTPPPEPTKVQRQQIFRAVRNFAEVNPPARAQIIRTLQDFGLMAQPFVSAALQEPFNLQNRIDLFESLAVPGEALSAGSFAEVHAQAVSSLENMAVTPAPPQPEDLTQEDLKHPLSKADWLRVASSNVLKIEGYATAAGGPFNTLFLLNTYRQRYGGPTIDPLLADIRRDAARLADAARDAKRARTSWTSLDRITVAEQVFPQLFADNENLNALAQPLLKNVLPAGHPGWDAPQAEWVAWWLTKGRPSLLKAAERQ